jgi:hypothetical protein
MSDEELKVYQEVTTSQTALASLHPLRLDRWHRTLLGLPEALYMQLGVKLLFEHVDAGARALRGMVELLGVEGLPLEVREITRRHVGEFSWHVPSRVAETGTHNFATRWDKDSSSWKLERLDSGGNLVIKTVASLEQALEKSQDWARQLDGDPPATP